MNNLIIGIAGGSGSGKTTLSLRLKAQSAPFPGQMRPYNVLDLFFGT